MTDGRTLEGIAVPYGERVELRAGVWETFAPGAFAQDVAAWNARADGARVPFVSSHPGEGSRTVLGTVEELTDTPAGVRFRARLVDTQAAREYAELVRAGANGVSVEFAPVGPLRVGRDGALRHQAARLLAIAGAVAPAYDSARVAVRSRRVETMTDPTRPDESPDDTDQEETQDQGGEATTAAPLEVRETRMSAPAGRITIPSDQERRSREVQVVGRMTGSAPRVTRQELVYTRNAPHRFLRDGLRAAGGDMEAMGRLGRHYAILEDLAERAVTTTDDIPGTYPAEYVPGLLVTRLLQGRPAGSFFQRIPVSDARTRTYPKVTEHTVVHAQAVEGVNEAVSSFKTAPVSATPGMLMGMVDVSRQVIDGGDPDAERMILDDLMESYAQVSESSIVTQLIAGATAGTHPVDAAAPHAGLVGSIASFPTARFLPAEGVFAPAAVFEGLILETDQTGRPMVPYVGPANAEGTVQAGGAAASVLGVPVYNSWAQPDTYVLVARRADAFYYESAVVQFRYEQIGGPAAIRIGIWAYLTAQVRRAEGVVKESVTPDVP